MKTRMRRAVIFLLVISLSIAASGASSVAGRAPEDKPDGFQAARRTIQKIVKDAGASGVAVAVAKDGKIVWEEGFGTVARGSDEPVTPDTMFALASVTKALTATGLMILSDRGAVDLDKLANEYLGAGKLKSCSDPAWTASVRNLVFHTSGLPMHWNIFYADETRPVPSMDESIARFGILTRPPGEAYVYSNFGYGVLGHILARVSGLSYAAFTKKEVFDPLGMTRSLILTEADRPANLAVKYDGRRKEVPVSFYDHPGASAAYGSIRDLLRFGMFQLGAGPRRVLKSATLAAMHRESGSQFRESSGEVKYLLGSFAQVDYQGVRFHSVTGGMPGAVSRLDLVPSEHIASAVLANSDGVDLWSLQREILAALLPALREKPAAPDRPGQGASKAFVPDADLRGRWQGTLRTREGDIPAALEFSDSGAILEIGGKRCSPLSVRTELGDMGFAERVFAGLFWGRVEAPETAGRPHVVHVRVKLGKETLSGSAAAVASDSRQSFCLPYCLELKKVVR